MIGLLYLLVVKTYTFLFSDLVTIFFTSAKVRPFFELCKFFARKMCYKTYFYSISYFLA